MQMYKTKFSLYSEPFIEKVQVEKVTDHFVIINKRRYARLSDYEGYYPTWNEAFEALQHNQKMKIDRIQSDLVHMQERMDKINALLKNTEQGVLEA